MKELRVPTVALAAEVLLADGRALSGRIFVPASASRHSGPMRPAEWMNEARPFFPFLPDDAERPVILNKQEVLVISISAAAEEEEAPPPPEEGERQVAVEFGGRRLEGTLYVEMPEGQRRVLDYLNRPETFLVLHEGQRVHLVQKAHIARIVEVPEG